VAAGVYHEVLDPLYYAAGIGKPGISAEAGRQFVAGMQIGEGRDMLRIEIYDKEYSHLSAFTEDNRALVDAGTGNARGAELFVKRQLWPFLSARATYSYVDSHRTAARTGEIARTPYDITNSLTLIGDQELAKGWNVSGAYRYATGKPFTPIVGGTFDAAERAYIPVYGAPYSERLPHASRVDLSLARTTRARSSLLVYFAEVENLLDRNNVDEYTYKPGYSERLPVRSLFKRSLYVGASLTHIKH
jgi:vitamin B12 transporter